jgi:hypothetical protein
MHSHPHPKPASKYGYLLPVFALVAVLALVFVALGPCKAATPDMSVGAQHGTPFTVAFADRALLPWNAHRNDSDCTPYRQPDPQPQPLPAPAPQPEQHSFPTGAVVALCLVGSALGLKKGWNEKFHSRSRAHKH